MQIGETRRFVTEENTVKLFNSVVVDESPKPSTVHEALFFIGISQSLELQTWYERNFDFSVAFWAFPRETWECVVYSLLELFELSITFLMSVGLATVEMVGLPVFFLSETDPSSRKWPINLVMVEFLSTDVCG